MSDEQHELTITHTQPDGTLIEGTSRNDGTAEILKSCGWRWSRHLGAWFVPQSRDRAAKSWIIDNTRNRLKAAGHTVTVTIDDTHRTTAEVEADKIDRQAARVDALETKASRRQHTAEMIDARAHELAQRVPLGQPILIGHHSEGRMRRHYDQVDRTARAAVDAQRDADEVTRRAESAAHTTGARYSPVTVANRIDKLEAEIRNVERQRDGYTRNAGTPYAEDQPPAEGDYRARLVDQLEQLHDQLIYWRQIRDTQIADGTATNYGPDTIHKGDHVKIRSTWYEVIRANKRTVTVPSTIGSWTNTSPYHEIQDHRTASEQVQ